MASGQWLQISEYSNKHRISVSAIRRRIKSGEVEHRFDQGKYWIFDAPVEKYLRQKPAPQPKAAPIQEEKTSKAVVENDAMAVAQAMMTELKAAYVQILQEKQEQILQLKEELTDLRTLCRILEDENNLLKAKATMVSPVTDWLSDGPDSDANA